MATKPTDFPDWATTLENDATSGQPNRDKPPTDKQESGYDFEESPPRQWINWKFWNLSDWVKWFDQQEQVASDHIDDGVLDAPHGMGTMAAESASDYTKQVSGGAGIDASYLGGDVRDVTVSVDSTVARRNANNNFGGNNLTNIGSSDVQSFQVGGGAVLAAIRKASKAISSTSIASNASQQENITVTGVSTGDTVSYSIDGALGTGIAVAEIRITSPDTVTIIYKNTDSGSSQTLQAHTIYVSVFSY